MNRLRGDGWIENEHGEFLVAHNDGTPVIRDGCADRCADPTRLGDIVDALVKQRADLRAALKEALDGWDRERLAGDDAAPTSATPSDWADPCSRELRGLVEP